MIRLWVLGALVLALPACARWIAPVYDEVIPTRVDLDIYPKLYPDAVELDGDGSDHEHREHSVGDVSD